MDLLTERRLGDVFALRRIGEAALLRDSDKVPELMNLHCLDFRRSRLHCSGFLLPFSDASFLTSDLSFQCFSVSKIRYSAANGALSKPPIECLRFGGEIYRRRY